MPTVSRPTWTHDRDRGLLLHESGETIAHVIETNPIADASPGSKIIATPKVSLATYSGWIGSTDGDPAGDTAGGRPPYPTSPQTWLGGGRAAFNDWVNTLIPELDSAGTQLLLRPVATHVISDIPSIRTAMDLGQPIRFILNPALLLTHTMLADLDDHFARFGEALGQHPKLAAVELSDIRRANSEAESEAGTGLWPASGEDALIGEPRLLAWLDRWVAPTTPIIRSIEGRESSLGR